MHDLAKLSDLARAEIEILERDGITLTAAEVIEINALAWSVQTPETRRLLSRGRPVLVGGAWLWPLTLRAVEWLDVNEVPLDRVTPGMGYAMAFGRSEGHEMDATGREAQKAINQWFKTLKCTPDEFTEAVQQVDQQDQKPAPPPDVDGKPMTIGDFSAFLAATCGGDVDFWERRCSNSFCISTLSMFVIHNHADKRPCSQDPRIIADRNLGCTIERIRKERAQAAQAVPCG